MVLAWHEGVGSSPATKPRETIAAGVSSAACNAATNWRHGNRETARIAVIKYFIWRFGLEGAHWPGWMRPSLGG